MRCVNDGIATAAGASSPAARSGIMSWEMVRVLSAPPRTLSNREISRRRPRSPQLAGSCGCVSVSAETVSGLKAILGGLSLGRGIPFPRCRLILDEDWSGCGGYTREDQASGADGTIPRAGRRGGQLPIPYAETSIDGRLDEIGREEGERDCLVDLTDAAALAACDGFGAGLGIGHEFLEPAASTAIDATSSARLSERMGRASVAPDTGRGPRGAGLMVFSPRHFDHVRSFCVRLDLAPPLSASSITS